MYARPMGLSDIIGYIRHEGAVLKQAPMAFCIILLVGSAVGWWSASTLSAERIAVLEQRALLHEDRAKFSDEQLKVFERSLADKPPGEVDIRTDNPAAAELVNSALKSSGWAVQEGLVSERPADLTWEGVLLEAPAGQDANSLRAALEAAGITYEYKVLAEGETPRLWFDYVEQEK